MWWQRQWGGDGGGIGIERLLDDRCEADLAVGGAGGGMNNAYDDDNGARRWAEAQRAMYGRCATGTDNDEELRAINRTGLPSTLSLPPPLPRYNKQA
jgi:hypothetical protein